MKTMFVVEYFKVNWNGNKIIIDYIPVDSENTAKLVCKKIVNVERKKENVKYKKLSDKTFQLTYSNDLVGDDNYYISFAEINVITKNEIKNLK